VLVVSVPSTDERPPPQGVFEVEGTAEDPLGGGEGGDRTVEEPVEDLGALRRQEVQPGGTRFPHVGRRWGDSAGRGRGSRRGSEASEWELRECQEREDERRCEAEVLGTGKELPLFLPTPPFMASAGKE